MKEQSFDTKCIQAGYSPGNGEARVVPIYQSTTYAWDKPEDMAELFNLSGGGYFYARLGNPTNTALEEKISALEGGTAGLATSAGMAATMMSVINVCDSGDNFISTSEVYGGTYNLFNVTLRKLGIDCRFVSNNADSADIEALIDDKTKAIFLETIANPAGIVADFDKFVAIGKKYGIIIIVDNTIATPYICRPLEHGCNIIVHATTKYIDGHATSLGGIIIDGGNFDYKNNPRYPGFNKPDDSYHGLVFADAAPKFPFALRARGVAIRDIGAIMSPMNAFLTNLGCETLHLRMVRHSENGLALASALKKHPQVEWVKYAGLEDDEDHAKAMKYFTKGYCSGMVTFGIKGGREAAVKFQKELKLFKVVTHVADARSCVLHPASTTHRQLSDSDLEACGVAPNLIRLSVGIEATEDIIYDVTQALDKTQ